MTKPEKYFRNCFRQLKKRKLAVRVGRAATSPPAARCLELETSLGGEGSLLERASTSFSARDVARVAHRASPAVPHAIATARAPSIGAPRV